MKGFILLSSLLFGGQNISATASNLNDQNLLTRPNRATDLTEIKIDEIGASWNNEDLLKFDFSIKARAYANWINAYYAYATSRLEVKEITFTN